MSIFNQHGQNVGYQQNAGHDINLKNVQINFDHIKNQSQLREELENLKSHIKEAAEAQIIDAETYTDADEQITKAIQKAGEPNPDKTSIISHLNNTKSVLEGVTAMGTIVESIESLFQLIISLF